MQEVYPSQDRLVGAPVSVSKPWKAFERRHAARMGGERIWRQDFSEVAPDGESATDTWDCKCYASHAAVTMFVDAERKYRPYTKNRRFHLALFSRAFPRAGDFVLLKAEDFAVLLDKERQLDERTS